MRFRTKQIHAGVKPDPTTGAILTPIYQSTTFVQPSVDEYLASGYSYSRSANPTVRAWEEKIASLEDGAGLRKYTDIVAVSEIATSHGIPHAVDNTFLTPYYQRALDLGDDLSIHSTTKYLDGHNATVGGSVISATAELHERVAYVQNATGTIMSPQVAWLTLQGVKTLSERMDRQSDNAMQVARFLEAHPRVSVVQYPGLESFPQHDLAKRQASGFGAMVWFEVEGGLEAGKRLIDGLGLWTLAENLGSVESLVTHPVTMTHADVGEDERARVGITDGLLRLSVGLEDVEDLIEDLSQALDSA